MPKCPRRAARGDQYKKFKPRTLTEAERTANRAARDARNAERTAQHHRVQLLISLARGGGAQPDFDEHENFDIGFPQSIGSLGYSSTDITPNLHNEGGVSFQAGTYAELSNDRGVVDIKRSFNASNKTVLNSSQLCLAVHNTIGEIEDAMREMHEMKKSGLSIHRVLETVVRVRPYQPNQGPVVGGGLVYDHAIGHYLKLQQQLVSKQCTRNIIDKQPRCVENCIELALYLRRSPVATWQTTKKKPRKTVKHKVERPSRDNEGRPLPQKDRVLDLSGLSSPIRTEELAILEERHNIAVHILTQISTGDELLTLAHTRSSPNRNPDAFHIHLIEVWASDRSFSHCALVKDVNALLNCEKEQRYYSRYCPYCLLGFGGAKATVKLDAHLRNGCGPNAEPSHAEWRLPKEGSPDSLLTFKLGDIAKKFPHEYIVYATMQYADVILSEDSLATRHWVGFCVRLVCNWDCAINTEITYVATGSPDLGGEQLRGDIIDRYLDALVSLGTAATEHRKRPSLPLVMTDDDRQSKALQSECTLCGLPLYGGYAAGMSEGATQIVHERDHRTGKFRGMEHAQCNLFFTDVKKRNEKDEAWSWTPIPVICNELTPIHQQVFGRAVQRSIHGKPIVREANDWVSYSIGNLKTGILQTISSTSFLGQKDQRLKDANLAQLQQFEQYRAKTLMQLGFDAARFLTVNKLAWKYMISMAPKEKSIVNNLMQTRYSKIELLDSRHEDILAWMQSEYPCRGGICIAPGRHADAQDGVIVAFDFTRFYPGEMKRSKLPVGDYQWAHERLYDAAALAVEPCDGDIGYTVTFAGWYPPECHDRLRFLPPLAHYVQVDEEQLHAHQRSVLAAHGIKHRSRQQLMLSLLAKERYTCTLSLLQLAIRLGFVVAKVIKVLQYRQANTFWGPSVDALHQRIIDGETHLKPVINAGYGQTGERKDRYTNSTVVKTRHEMLTQTRAAAQYVGESPLSNELLLVRKTRKKVLMDMPMLQCATILDKSKQRLLHMFYDVLLPIFGDTMELLCKYTDSLLCQFKGIDQTTFHAKLAARSSLWQGSLGGADAIVFEGKGVPSSLKIEGYPLQYVGLHQKCYTTVYSEAASGDRRDAVKAAGVPSRVLLRVEGELKKEYSMSYELMKQALDDPTLTINASYTRIGVRRDGSTGEISMNRTAFTPFDGSRWDAGGETLPFGHYKTRA